MRSSRAIGLQSLSKLFKGQNEWGVNFFKVSSGKTLMLKLACPHPQPIFVPVCHDKIKNSHFLHFSRLPTTSSSSGPMQNT